jgi:hypothetical protein
LFCGYGYVVRKSCGELQLTAIATAIASRNKGIWSSLGLGLSLALSSDILGDSLGDILGDSLGDSLGDILAKYGTSLRE